MSGILSLVCIFLYAPLCIAEEIRVLPQFYVEYGEVVEGDISSVSIEGVQVQQEDRERALVLPWYAIDAWGSGWQVPPAFRVIAKNSRIGYGRRMRGDLSGCASLYMTIASQLVGSESDMGREIFRGLLDDALIRRDFYDASVAYRCYQLSLGDPIDQIDDRYGVHVGIPMISGSSSDHQLGDIAKKLAEFDRVDLKLVQRLKQLSDNSVGDSPDSELLIKERSPSAWQTILGQDLYLFMYSAQANPDPDQRAEARRWLLSRAESKPGTWIDLWCRLAIGSSYIYESVAADDESMCSLGVVHLLHAIVRFQSEYPMLAQVARELGTQALIERGRFEEAAQLFGGMED